MLSALTKISNFISALICRTQQNEHRSNVAPEDLEEDEKRHGLHFSPAKTAHFINHFIHIAQKIVFSESKKRKKQLIKDCFFTIAPKAMSVLPKNTIYSHHKTIRESTKNSLSNKPSGYLSVYEFYTLLLLLRKFKAATS